MPVQSKSHYKNNQIAEILAKSLDYMMEYGNQVQVMKEHKETDLKAFGNVTAQNQD